MKKALRKSPVLRATSATTLIYFIKSGIPLYRHLAQGLFMKFEVRTLLAFIGVRCAV